MTDEADGELHPSESEVASRLIAAFGSFEAAEDARRRLLEVARQRKRADALLTLMRAETWIALRARLSERRT